MPRFVTAGNLTIDELIFPDGRHEVDQVGGNSLFAAIGAHIWADSVGILSLAGLGYSWSWLDLIQEAGIEVRGISELMQPHGMRAGFVYGEDSERRLLEGGKAGRKETERFRDEHEVWLVHSPGPEHIPATYCNAVGVHLAPMPTRAHARLVAALKQPGRCITVDSPWWDGLDQKRAPDLELLGSLDALLPSQAEVEAYFGGPVDPVMAARELGQLGPSIVVVKIGARGSVVYSWQEDSIVHVPAYPSLTVDPTGAGDAFGGGFLVGLVETRDAVKAACYGTISASFVVEGYGAHYALHVERSAAQERLRTLVPRPLRRKGDKLT